MKKILLAVALLAALTGAAWAQTYAELQASIQSLADGVTASMPISATIGLNWSHAYIGQFPHFGVGVSVGGMFLPYESWQPIVDTLGLGADIPEQLKTWGLPFPTIAAGARLGGFGLPFDMGFKFAMVPPETAPSLFGPDVSADFYLIGGDVRLPVVKGKGLVPTVSIGAGYTFLRGDVSIADVSAGQTIDISDVMLADGWDGAAQHDLIISDPDLIFNWDTHTIDAKVQASWNALIFTPSVGIGAAYGISNAGGGLSSSLSYVTDDVGSPTFADMQTAFSNLGYPVPTATGIEVVSDANGWSFWVFGGTAINLFFIKVDLSAMYNFLNGDYGGSVNVRVQL